MIDYLAIDVINPMYCGYMEDCEFQEALNKIMVECGNRVETATLTAKLKENGLDICNLTRSQLNTIDSCFDCYK